MASVTAEVLLYFGTDDPEFRDTVDAIRFGQEIDNSVTIIKLLRPVWGVAYDKGYEDGVDD